MMDATSSFLPELDIRPITFGSPENVAEHLGTPSPRNSTEKSLPLNTIQHSPCNNALRGHEESQLSRVNEILESPLDAINRGTPDVIGIQNNVSYDINDVSLHFNLNLVCSIADVHDWWE